MPGLEKAINSFHAVRLFHRRNVKNQKMLEGSWNTPHPLPLCSDKRWENVPKSRAWRRHRYTAKTWPCQASNPAVITGPGTRPGSRYILLALDCDEPNYSTEPDFRPSHGKPSSNFASLAKFVCVFENQKPCVFGFQRHLVSEYVGWKEELLVVNI